MSQLILLYFLLTNGSQWATTVCKNPVDMLKAQAHNMIQEQGSVLFFVKYFAAEILMCSDHHVPCSSLTQCFLSFHGQWRVKEAEKHADCVQQSCVSLQLNPVWSSLWAHFCRKSGNIFCQLLPSCSSAPSFFLFFPLAHCIQLLWWSQQACPHNWLPPLLY